MTHPTPLPFAPTGLDHVVFRSTDGARLAAFYCEVLGCTLERGLPGKGLAQLRAGRSLIDIVPSESCGDAGRVDHVCLGVHPFDEAALRKHLQQHRVAVIDAGPRYGAEGLGPSIYLHDPDGNAIELKGVAAPLC
nr:VOC family protein [uncultured Roseateles sp.]